MGRGARRAPRRRRAALGAAACAAVAGAPPLAAAPAAPGAGALVVDLSHHLVAITTAFAGSEVLAFGTVGAPGRDVIVTVSGPPTDTSVRRKTRVGFVWLNTEVVTFRAVPAFYAVAASGPLEELTDPAELDRHRVGAARIPLEPIAIEGLGDRRVPAFKEALLRRKERQGLYAGRVGRVAFVGGNLFRTTLRFPTNVPPGPYEVRILELERGRVVAAQTRGLRVSKVGLEADLTDVAQRRAALYALGSIGLAVGAGWGAAFAFRRA